MSNGYWCALIGVACGIATAADWTPLDVKPGVWETTATTQRTGTPLIPQAALDKMPPDQRAKIEAAFPGGNGQPTTATHRSCIKKEDLSKPLFENSNPNCKSTLVSSTGSKREILLECETPNTKTSGTTRIEVVNSENVKVASQMTSTGRTNMGLNVTANSKWVGAVCTGKEN